MQLVAPQLYELSSFSSQWSTDKQAQNSENRRMVYLWFEMEHIHFSPCSRREFFLTVQTDGLSMLGFLNRCASNKKIDTFFLGIPQYHLKAIFRSAGVKL